LKVNFSKITVTISNEEAAKMLKSVGTAAEDTRGVLMIGGLSIPCRSFASELRHNSGGVAATFTVETD